MLNPVCIAAGHRTERTADKPLAVIIEELRHAGQAIM